MMAYKILNTIGEVFTPEAKKILEQIGEVDYLIPAQDKLAEIASQYNIFVVGLGLNFTKEIIDKATNLKVIATATTGLDHIDVDYAKSKGIEILSLRGENKFLDTITGTAELAFGLLIALARQIPAGFDSVKNYEWGREKFRGRSLYRKTLGLVGLGRLGKMMVRYGSVFGMNIIFFDPHKSQKDAAKLKCKKVSFGDLLTKSDVISVHVHLNPETENMFNKAVFARMKSVAYLINTSRGKIVNEKNLLEALKKRRIAGCATDVLADELNFDKKFKNHPLVEYARKNSNLIIVPHIGGMTYESREATDIFIAQKLERCLKK